MKFIYALFLGTLTKKIADTESFKELRVQAVDVESLDLKGKR